MMTSHPIITALMPPTSVFICHYFQGLFLYYVLRQQHTWISAADYEFAICPKISVHQFAFAGIKYGDGY